MEFNDYLISKNIDPIALKENEENLFSAWELMFKTVHPTSFTDQKKFQINQIRRKYPLKKEF